MTFKNLLLFICCTLLGFSASTQTGTTLNFDGNNNSIKRLTEAYTSNRSAVVIEQISTPAPTTNFITQIYTGDDKDLSTLQITGTAIQWYSAATGDTALPSTTLLTDDTTYYASQTLGGIESTARLAITANRISDNTQQFSPGDTVADLVSTPNTGTTATWYTMASGGTALTGTEALSAGTYFVEEVTLETIETLGSGFLTPAGLTEQADGKIVVADANNNIIKRMNADGTGIESLGSGFFTPIDVAVQADGKIVVADANNNSIKRMNTDGTGIETLGSGFFTPYSVAVQADGKILVADFNNNAIKRMNADGTGIETLGSGFNQPTGVAIQPDGKILITDSGNNAIKRMNADGTSIETLGSGFNLPADVALQPDGKIVVADFNNNAIKRMNADGTGIETLGSGFNGPFGIAIQADGKILLSDSGNNAIKRLTEAYTSNRVPVILSQVLSVEEVNFNLALQVYPNPVNDKLHITVKNGLIITQITIIDVLGKKLLTTMS